MAQQAVDRLIHRCEELESERKTTENTFQQIADNELGRRQFTARRTPGEQRMQRIYDDTSKVSGSLLAGAIHATMSSPNAKWFEFEFEDPRLNEISEAMEWLDLAEKRIYAAIRAPEANFHAQLSEVYTDLIYFGTGALWIDDVPGKGVRFSARPLQELYLAEDPSGRIDTIARKFQLTARQAVELWGSAARSAKAALDGGSSEDRHSYWHLIVPNDDVVVGSLSVSGMPWASFHIDQQHREILSSGGFPELPIATPRWEQDAGEVYGRGPGWNALSNQKMLSEMKRVKLKVGQRFADPINLVDQDAVLPGNLSMHPGAVVPVSMIMNSMNPPIQQLTPGGTLQYTTEDIIDARKAVQDSFHHQLVEVIRDPRMTATQVLELAAQMQRHMAPILGRLTTELLEVTLNRVTGIEARAGRLPPAPEFLGDQPYRFNYVSPVARAQQTSEARAIIDFSGVAVNMAQAEPEVLDVVDFDDGLRRLGAALGVPPSMVRDSRQVEVRREAAAQLAEEQAAQQEAVMATDQIAKLAKAVPQQQGAA